MKNFVIVLFALIIGFIFGFYLGNKHQVNNNGDDIVDYKHKFDSILSITPDTVRITDTLFVDSIIENVVYKPMPVDSSNGVNIYKDTIVNPDFDFYFHADVDGRLLMFKSGYKLKVPRYIYDTTYIYQKIPQIVEVDKKIQYKAYLTGSVGFNYYSVGFGKIIKNRHAIGINGAKFRDDMFLTVGYSYFF